jgi:hypothetical protein
MIAVAESWYPVSRHDYSIILEDDIEVAQSYYVWAKANVLRYRYTPSRDATERKFFAHLFGISLYTPRIQEMTFPRQKFRPDQRFNSSAYEPNTAFLWQLPCSWGALYFPDKWLEFREYLFKRTTKMTLPDLVIPKSRSNVWKHSWKKYFIEMIVIRAYVMLYPNFPNQTSFSTNHLEPGIHIGSKSRTRLEMLDDFRVPLHGQGNV